MILPRCRSLGIDGPGPALVLLPGMVGDADTFARQAPLGRLGPVFAVDLPVDPRMDRIPRIAAGIEALLPEGELVLLGVSLGALVARSLARRLGPRVLGVVGVGALPHPRHVPARLRLMAPLLRVVPHGIARRAWRTRVSRAMALEGVPVAEQARLLRRLPPASVGQARLDAVLHLAPDPGPIPAAWLRGQLEREAPWTVAEAAQALPGASVATIPGGHRAHWTHAGAFNAVASGWWRALASPTG